MAPPALLEAQAWALQALPVRRACRPEVAGLHPVAPSALLEAQAWALQALLVRRACRPEVAGHRLRVNEENRPAQWQEHSVPANRQLRVGPEKEPSGILRS